MRKHKDCCPYCSEIILDKKLFNEHFLNEHSDIVFDLQRIDFSLTLSQDLCDFLGNTWFKSEFVLSNILKNSKHNKKVLKTFGEIGYQKRKDVLKNLIKNMIFSERVKLRKLNRKSSVQEFSITIRKKVPHFKYISFLRLYLGSQGVLYRKLHKDSNIDEATVQLVLRDNHSVKNFYNRTEISWFNKDTNILWYVSLEKYLKKYGI